MYGRDFLFATKAEGVLHSFPLQRLLCGDPNFFKINSKIKGKCSLNAGFFKRKLRRIPLIKIDKHSQQHCLKGELSNDV